jgi:Ca-activated chloride channel family protein
MFFSMLSTWFAYPVLLLTLLAVPVCSTFFLFAYFRRRQMTARLGSSLLLRKSVFVRHRVRRWKGFCILTGVALVAIASAGPQWGLDKSAQHRKGRDVILVLDLSRSMNAEQPSRRELAIRALRHLADTFEEHGGNRIALIAFAARPRLLFPLTQDCDHLRHVLSQIEAEDIPKLSVEEPLSGTRIGAALKLALESFDRRRANRPVIVLLSDGDDPAEDDEWLEGVTAASSKQIRIHTVGIGNPHAAENIPAGRDYLLYDGKPISTKLNETRLREIARRTDGIYIPAQTQTLPLGTFVQHLLDADELREEEATDDELPVYRLRYAWFLFPAVLLFMLTTFLNEGPNPSRNEPKMPPNAMLHENRRRATPLENAAVLLIILTAVLNVSAAPSPSADSLLRQGNEAFARQEYEEALKWYEQAESLTLDPGVISFNKAAAYYRMGRYRDAVECYRRCLEDDEAPVDRRARAHFDLGNALVRYAEDNAQTLAEAVQAYRGCLHQPKLSAKLRTDARHNLEIAQLLWLKAGGKLPDDKKTDPDKPPYPPEHDDKKNNGSTYVAVNPSKDGKRQEVGDLANAPKPKHMRSQGASKHLPDEERVHPQSPEDTLATLAEHARRIAQARIRQRNPEGPAALTTKDW